MKKFAMIGIEMITYFFVMLVILLIFKRLGWTNVDAVSYAVTVTIGWTVGKSIFSAAEKRREKKRGGD